MTTTRAGANALLGDVVRGDTPVTVVQVQGNVNGRLFPHPPGTPTPTGRYVVLVMDDATGAALDVAIRDTPADLGEAACTPRTS